MEYEVLKDQIPAVMEEANERPEREPKRAEHGRSYNKALAAELCYLIDFTIGQSFGAAQPNGLPGKNVLHVSAQRLDESGDDRQEQ